MKRVLVFVAALAALMTIGLTAQAHTESQLEEWQEDWQGRFEAFIEDHGVMSSDLMAERHDWFDRHPCSSVLGTYTEAECRPAQTHTRTASTGSGNPPSSVNTGMGTNVEQWRPLVSAYFGPYTDEALRVIRCESGGNTYAKNPTSSASGLFQVLGGWADTFGYARSDLFIPEVNVKIAKILFDDGAKRGNRWSHWVCKP